MIHITLTAPAQIQEFELQTAAYGTPRSARRTAISPRRAHLGEVSLSALPNTVVEWPLP